MEFHELFSLMEQHDKNSEVLSRFGNNARLLFINGTLRDAISLASE